MADLPEAPHKDVRSLLTGHFHETSGYRAVRRHGVGDWLLIHTISGRGRVGHTGGDLMVQAAGNSTFLGGIQAVKPVAAVTPIYVKVTDAAIASITAGKIVIVLQVLNPLKFAG